MTEINTTEKTSSVAINKAISNVKQAFSKSNDLVQKAMILVVEHAMAYGDCTGAARLVDAMPKSARRSLVINHFSDYSPINVVKDAKTGLMRASLRKPDSDKYNDWNMDGLKANRWDQRAEADNEPDILTFGEAKETLDKTLKSLETKAAKSPDGADILQFVKKVRVAMVAGQDSSSVAAPEAAAA